MPNGRDDKMRQPPQGKQDKIAIFLSADRGERGRVAFYYKILFSSIKMSLVSEDLGSITGFNSALCDTKLCSN